MVHANGKDEKTCTGQRPRGSLATHPAKKATAATGRERDAVATSRSLQASTSRSAQPPAWPSFWNTELL